MRADEIVEDLMSLYGQDVWDFAFSLALDEEEAGRISQEVFIEVGKELKASSWKVASLQATRRFARGKEDASFFVEEEAWREVLALPVKDREAVVLASRFHLTVPEIAEVLGVQESTVMRRLQRAGGKRLLPSSPVRGNGFFERDRTHVRDALRHTKTPSPPRLLPWVFGFLLVVLAAMLLMRLSPDVVK